MKSMKKVQTNKPKIQQINQKVNTKPITKPNQQTFPNQNQPKSLPNNFQKIKYVAKEQNQEQILFEQEQHEEIQVIQKINVFPKPKEESNPSKYLKAFNNTIIRSRPWQGIYHETQSGQIIASLDFKQSSVVNFEINMGSEKIVLIRFYYRSAFDEVEQWSWNLETLEVVKIEKNQYFSPYSLNKECYPQIPIIVFQKSSLFCVFEKRKGAKHEKILNYYKIPLQAQNFQPVYSIEVPNSLSQLNPIKVDNQQSFTVFNSSNNNDQAKFYIINPKSEENIKQFTFQYDSSMKKKHFTLQLTTVWEAAPGIFYLKIHKKISQIAYKQILKQQYEKTFKFLQSRERYFHILWNSETKKHRVIRIIQEKQQNYEIQFTTGLRQILTIETIHQYCYYPGKMQKPQIPNYYQKSVFYVDLKKNLVVASEIKGKMTTYHQYQKINLNTVKFVELIPLSFESPIIYTHLMLSLFQFDQDLLCETIALFEIKNKIIKKGWTPLNNAEMIKRREINKEVC